MQQQQIEDPNSPSFNFIIQKEREKKESTPLNFHRRPSKYEKPNLRERERERFVVFSAKLRSCKH
jgi:hypothetical protein